ncbi:MAG: Hpt domain-containing protein [Desulfovibrio sp.]|nr:Hpt domain-containing protein [Desulfovibrio sp.]
MDATRKERLKAAGINVDGALERFMGNEAMLERFLGRFLEEKSYAALAGAVAADDAAGAAAAVHTLKSVCGSLGCDRMQQLALAQEAKMRADDWPGAKAMMPELAEEYDRICAALRG